MSEEQEAKTEEKAVEFKAPASQEEFDRMVGDRLTRERAKFADYDDLKTKAAKFDEHDAANKTELQKATERAEAAERKAAEVETRALRLEVGTTKGLTPAQAARLMGSTKEELEADADDLLATFKPAPAKRDPKFLKSGSTATDDTSTGKEKAAAAMRSWRTN